MSTSSRTSGHLGSKLRAWMVVGSSIEGNMSDEPLLIAQWYGDLELTWQTTNNKVQSH
jgi:hypothetical protein